MNYQQPGMLSDLAPQQQDGLARLMQYLYQTQQEPMLTGQMMLAQNNYQPVGMQRAGLTASGDYPAQQAPESPQGGYSLGNATPEEIKLRERQRIESAVKLGLPPNATDAQIRDAQMKINAKKTASPGTR